MANSVKQITKSCSLLLDEKTLQKKRLIFLIWKKEKKEKKKIRIFKLKMVHIELSYFNILSIEQDFSANLSSSEFWIFGYFWLFQVWKAQNSKFKASKTP